MTDLQQFILDIPKVELHLHIEGTLEPEMLFALADRNGVELPYRDLEELRSAYEFDCLQDFLEVYYRGAGVLQQEQDFYDLTRSYLDRAHSENVRHAEIFFDPQTHTARGVPFDTVIDGIWKALRDAEAEYGLTSRLILCFLRDLPATNALETLEHGLRYKDRIAAVGLDSSEMGHPPSKFVEVFERARAAGLRAVAHAGEEGPPEYIWEALDLLKVERIDHGVRCLEDPDLVERLSQERVPLTVCPLSNVRLRVFDSMDTHNLRQLMAAGLMATVNSDDPAYFGGYISDNFLAATEALGLDKNDLLRLVRNSVEASFIGEKRKTKILAELAEVSSRY